MVSILKCCNHYLYYRHYIPARMGARRVMARGAFPRAEVIRGTDWDYGDDDGKLTMCAFSNQYMWLCTYLHVCSTLL